MHPGAADQSVFPMFRWIVVGEGVTPVTLRRHAAGCTKKPSGTQGSRDGSARAGVSQAHPVVEPVLERRLSLVRRHGEPLGEPTPRPVDLLVAFPNAEAG